MPTVTIERIKLTAPGSGIYTANSYHVDRDRRRAVQNPRFYELIERGGRITAKWTKDVGQVIDDPALQGYVDRLKAWITERDRLMRLRIGG